MDRGGSLNRWVGQRLDRWAKAQGWFGQRGQGSRPAVTLEVGVVTSPMRTASDWRRAAAVAREASAAGRGSRARGFTG